MGYRIEDGEPPVAGLRRAVLEQIARAEERLGPDLVDDPGKGVHEARKAIKRARSGLRLGRPVFGGKAVRAEIGALRDAAGRLSAARDAEVARGVLGDVAARGVGRLPEAAWDELAQALDERAGSEGPALLTRNAELARSDLAAVRGRIGAWPREDHASDLDPVLAGLARAQARGARALEAARKGAHPDARHDLRKRVKDAWYQLELLQALWPEVVGAHAEEAHRLSSLLGDEHDLAVLSELLAGLSDVAVDVAPVHEVIAPRRDELWSEALPLARRLYAERPKALARRLEAYAVVSRSGSTSSSAGTGSPTTLV